jgi:hypothetical protein
MAQPTVRNEKKKHCTTKGRSKIRAPNAKSIYHRYASDPQIEERRALVAS